MSSPEELRAKIAELWKQSQPIVRQRLEVLAHAQHSIQSGTFSESLREEAIRQAHNLAGSLGMFGFPEASRSASEIEQLLETKDPSLDALGKLLQDLEQQIT